MIVGPGCLEAHLTPAAGQPRPCFGMSPVSHRYEALLGLGHKLCSRGRHAILQSSMLNGQTLEALGVLISSFGIDAIPHAEM